MRCRRLGRVLLLAMTTSVSVCVRANHSPIGIRHDDMIAGFPAPVTESEIEVVDEFIRIVFALPKDYRSTPMARVHVQYRLRNPTGHARSLQLGFPVFGYYDRQNDEPWFQARVNGKSLEVHEQKLGDPVDSFRKNGERIARHSKALAEWTEKVPGLPERIENLRRVSRQVQEAKAAREAFLRAAKQDLRDPRLLQAASQFADPSRRAIWFIMTPPFARRSALNEEASDAARRELLKAIEQWVSSDPALVKLAEGVRRANDLKAQRDRLLAALEDFLDDECDLSPAYIGCLASYCAGDPHTWWQLRTVSDLAPSFQEELRATYRAKRALVSKWHWDNLHLSPVTGELYAPSFTNPIRSLFGQDLTAKHKPRAEILPLVFFPGPAGGPFPRFPPEPPPPAGQLPTLMRYDVAVEPRTEITLTIDYETLIDYDSPLYSSYYCPLPQFTYILKTAQYWKSFGPIDIRISVPKRYHAVIRPVPQSQVCVADGTDYHLAVRDVDENLHVALVDRSPKSPMRRFTNLLGATDENLGKLRTLTETTTHPAAIALVRATIDDVARRRNAKRARAKPASAHRDTYRPSDPWSPDTGDLDEAAPVTSEIPDLWRRALDASDMESAWAKREEAVQRLLMRRDAALDYLMDQIPKAYFSRNVYFNPSLQEFECLPQFGEEALLRLLELSAGRPHRFRYFLARLLAIFPASDYPRLRAAAAEDGDLRVRKTALLAIGLIEDRDAVPLVAALLADEKLRRTAIEALGRIGDSRAIPILRSLNGQVAKLPHTHFRRVVWLDLISKVLAHLADRQRRETDA